MADRRKCAQCGEEFEKTLYFNHIPCHEKSGSHKNERKGRSGGHTSKLYFHDIQQPNQVSGVPGDVDVRTDFPSLDKLEESSLLPPPQALGADLGEENESSRLPSNIKPSTTVDRTPVCKETIDAWEKKLKKVDEIAHQLSLCKQKKKKLLQELKTNAAESQELQEKSQKLIGELNAEVQDLEFAAQNLRQEIQGMIQKFLQRGKLPVEMSKLRQDINFKMQQYEQLVEKISSLKESTIRRKLPADVMVKQITNCIEDLSLQDDQRPVAFCKPYRGDAPGSESNNQTTSGGAVGGILDLGLPDDLEEWDLR